MKYFLSISAIFVIALVYGFTQPSTVMSPVFNHQETNPLHEATNILFRIHQQPLDFSLLNTPFSEDSADTEIAGLIQVNENNDLIVNGELKDFMDYFLSSVGQVTPEQALQRMRLHFYQQLPTKAADQAMKILNDYLAFKTHSIDALSQPVDQDRVKIDEQYRFEQLQEALQTLHDLRRTHLGDSVAQALFEQDEAYAQYTLANMKTDLNITLSHEERVQQKILAKAELPVEMADIINEQETQTKTMQAYAAQLVKQPSLEGMSEFAFNYFDSEQAQIIVDDYQTQLQLKNKHTAFSQAMIDLDLNSLDHTNKQQAIQDLALQYFTAEEYSMIQAWQLAKENEYNTLE